MSTLFCLSEVAHGRGEGGGGVGQGNWLQTWGKKTTNVKMKRERLESIRQLVYLGGRGADRRKGSVFFWQFI